MKILDTKFVRGFVKMADDGFQQGWHERNGGNLSYRLKSEDIAIIELDEKGENYRIRWGLVEGGKPTSELPAHLMNHEVKKRVANGKHRVIYHAHTTNIIALTFGLMHTVKKSAEILLKIYAVRPDKLQTITAENFREVAKGFHVTLPEKFLYKN